ncbi:hypothetical protein M0J40_RS09295 [Providencia rettgeri]|nr:hypothetical protein [Providencia rettgeri]ELR5126659.1 hypothetical protein [Providencia rettgeri]ELR5243845.1 hypothetical protein [Providencia rettgeri]ELS4584850.1 hypothetical protein [Providencia rettgeri]
MEMTPQAVKAILAGIESGDATCLKIWAKAMMKKHNTTDESFDTLVIRAIMDEISGDKPEGTSEELERRFHKRTGYTFPASDELKQLFSQEA